MTAPEPSSDWIGGVRAALDALQKWPNQILEVRLGRDPHREPAQAIARLCHAAGIKLHQVERRQLDELLPGVHHQGVAIRRAPVAYAELEALLGSVTATTPTVLVILDDVTDPQNLGALLRSAWAFRVSGVIIPRHRSAGVTPAVARIASGGAEHVPVCRVRNTSDALSALKKAGFWVYGAAVDGAQALEEVRWAERVALVLGSEGRGLRPSVTRSCDLLFHIPMDQGAGSLNVGVAGAIALYAVYGALFLPRDQLG